MHIARRIASVLTIVSCLALLAGGVAIASGAVHLTPVLSGSMRPGLQPGDVVITKRVPTSAIRVGDVIVFHPPGSAELKVHRIATLERTDSGIAFTTKGDANNVADPWTARFAGSSAAAYRVVGSVPMVGWVAIWFHGQAAYRLVALLAGLVFAWAAVRQFWTPARKGKHRSHRTSPHPRSKAVRATLSKGTH